MILFPIEHPDKFHKFGMNPSEGVLFYVFYDPPGSGKTLWPKLLLTSVQPISQPISFPSRVLNFSPCGLANPKPNVREIFDKARSAAPCVLFFDELVKLFLNYFFI